MNKVRNVIEKYNHKWIIYAKKHLSNNEKLNAVQNFIAINEGQYDFKQNNPITFDIDDMKPLSESDYNSMQKD